MSIHDEFSNYDLLNYNGKRTFKKAILYPMLVLINYKLIVFSLFELHSLLHITLINYCFECLGCIYRKEILKWLLFPVRWYRNRLWIVSHVLSLVRFIFNVTNNHLILTEIWWRIYFCSTFSISWLQILKRIKGQRLSPSPFYSDEAFFPSHFEFNNQHSKTTRRLKSMKTVKLTSG